MEQDPDSKLSTEIVQYTGGIVEALKSSGIATREDVDEANGLLRECKARRKLLDEREKQITAPLNAALKSARDLFRKPKEALNAAERVLKGAIDGFLQAQERERMAAVQEASKAFASGDHAGGALAVQTVAALDVAPPAGLHFRESWGFEIRQPGLVPYELCSPDEGKIRAKLKLVNVRDKAPEIPGVHVFVKRTGVSRG